MRIVGGRHFAAAAGCGSAASILFLWKGWAAPVAVSSDPWAYIAWGRAVARLDQPIYDLTSTTPKPLGVLLGLLASPFPSARGFTSVVAIALGVLITGLVFAAWRGWGGAAAVVSVFALFLMTDLGRVLWYSNIDAVVAALIVLGIAVSGRGGLAALLVAGLIRPAAWPVSAVVAALRTEGRLGRRFAAGAIGGLAPVSLWLLIDFILVGDPLASLTWTRETRGTLDALGQPVRSAAPAVGSFLVPNLFGPGMGILRIVGVIGLAASLWKRSSEQREHVEPLLVALLWAGALSIEMTAGLHPYQRYLLPTLALLALGCGAFVGAVRTQPLDRFFGPLPTAAIIIIFIAIIIPRWEMRPGVERSAERIAAIEASSSVLVRALECGDVRVFAGHGARGIVRARAVIPTVAVIVKRPLIDFRVQPSLPKEVVMSVPSEAAILSLRPSRTIDLFPQRDTRGWNREVVPAGEVVLAPRCETLFGSR